MSAIYDIHSDHGMWIVRKDGDEWTRIASLIPGAYTEADEATLGNADVLADALLNASGALKLVLNQLAQHEEGSVHADRALAAIDAALRAAGRRG